MDNQPAKLSCQADIQADIQNLTDISDIQADTQNLVDISDIMPSCALIIFPIPVP